MLSLFEVSMKTNEKAVDKNVKSSFGHFANTLESVPNLSSSTVKSRTAPGLKF